MTNPTNPASSTLLTSEEKEGLLLTHITTKDELNRWENDNINRALVWVGERKPKDILNQRFMMLLHKKMFSDVWKWAGTFRQKEFANIGDIPCYQIAIELKKLCDDVMYWIEHKTFSEDEMAVRFHRKLVWIHSFSNGNGRHGRLMTDLLLENVLNQKVFTWGSVDLIKHGDDRQKYINALYAADHHNYKPLLEFVRL